MPDDRVASSLARRPCRVPSPPEPSSRRTPAPHGRGDRTAESPAARAAPSAMPRLHHGPTCSSWHVGSSVRRTSLVDPAANRSRTTGLLRSDARPPGGARSEAGDPSLRGSGTNVDDVTLPDPGCGLNGSVNRRASRRSLTRRGARPVASAHNRRALIKSGRGTGPMKPRQPTDAIGKVPSPGRSSCTIRELPFGDPLPSTDGRPVPRSRGAPQPPGDDHGDRDPFQPRRHDPARIARHALSQLRRDPADRAVLRLSGLFRPARGRLRLRGRRRDADPRGDRGRAPGIWRYVELLPVDAPPARGLPVGSTPLLAADRLAPSLGLDRLLDQGRHPQPVAQLQGSRRGGRRRAGRRVRRRGARLRLHRQPGRRDRGRRGRASGCRPTSSSRPTSSRPRSTTRSPTARRSSRSRAPTTTSTGCASRSPTRRAGASSTSTSARSTPRAPRRSPTRSPSRSAGDRPTSSSGRSRRARCSPASRAASRSSPSSASSSAGRSASSAARRPAARRSRRRGRPGPTSSSRSATPDTIVRSLAIGNPADGRYAVELANESGGSIEAIDDEVTAAAIRDVARLEGIYPETAGGVTLAAAAAARRRGRHPARRRGRRAADRQRAQDARRADARARRRRGPSRGAGARAGDPARACRRSSAGWAARHEHRPHPADAPGRDRRRQAGRGPGGTVREVVAGLVAAPPGPRVPAARRRTAT